MESYGKLVQVSISAYPKMEKKCSTFLKAILSRFVKIADIILPDSLHWLLNFGNFVFESVRCSLIYKKES